MTFDPQAATGMPEHAFNPNYSGLSCLFTIYVDHRSVICKQGKEFPLHDGTRPSPPDLEFPYPPCSVCGKDTYHDGDSLRCDPCGISWRDSGQSGEWDEMDAIRCPSSFKPHDHPRLSPEHESVRHFLNHCIREEGHEGKHRSNEWTEWTDDKAERGIE